MPYESELGDARADRTDGVRPGIDGGAYVRDNLGHERFEPERERERQGDHEDTNDKEVFDGVLGVFIKEWGA